MDNEKIREKLLAAAELDSAAQKEVSVEITYQILKELSTCYLNNLSSIEAPFYAGVFGALRAVLMDTMNSGAETNMMKMVERCAYKMVSPEISGTPFD